MILAMDVQYDLPGGGARAAGVAFDHWTSSTHVASFEVELDAAQPYVSGEFYRRELPCLRPLVEAASRDVELTTLVVDGFVDLGEGAPGLGRHLFEDFGGRWPVIGVAKNEYVGAPAVPVLRGVSTRPLWVTATRELDTVADNIRNMEGPHRLPTLLKLVDALARGR